MTMAPVVIGKKAFVDSRLHPPDFLAKNESFFKNKNVRSSLSSWTMTSLQNVFFEVRKDEQVRGGGGAV